MNKCSIDQALVMNIYHEQPRATFYMVQ